MSNINSKTPKWFKEIKIHYVTLNNVMIAKSKTCNVYCPKGIIISGNSIKLQATWPSICRLYLISMNLFGILHVSPHLKVNKKLRIHEAVKKEYIQ